MEKNAEALSWQNFVEICSRSLKLLAKNVETQYEENRIVDTEN